MQNEQGLNKSKIDGYFTMRDLAQILNTTVNALNLKLYKGRFPKPDLVFGEYRKNSGPTIRFWKKETINKYINTLNAKKKH